MNEEIMSSVYISRAMQHLKILFDGQVWKDSPWVMDDMRDGYRKLKSLSRRDWYVSDEEEQLIERVGAVLQAQEI